MIERVNGNTSLGDYFQKHIFEPLGMTATGFRPAKNENIRTNLSATTVRTPSGQLMPSAPFPVQDPIDDQGGGGLYSSPNDYVKVLVALLCNDGTLLKPETVDKMFTPQLPDSKYLEIVVNPPEGLMYRGGVDSQAWNYGLGGILNMEDVEAVCKKGTMSWGGLPNLFWVCLLDCFYNSVLRKLTCYSGSTEKPTLAGCMLLNYFHQVIRYQQILLLSSGKPL